MSGQPISNSPRIAYLDCQAGICGSMLLGALLDAGLNEQELVKGLHGLRISAPRAAAPGSAGNPLQNAFRPPYRPDFRLERESVLEYGIGATRVRVLTHDKHPHRGLGEIEKIIGQSELPEPVRAQSIAVFRRLAEAEAKIHRVDIQSIHFHEVGAIDAIVDVVGSVLGLHLLGIDRICASPVNVGGGFVRCEHGLMPVPAPATAELLKAIPSHSPEIKTKDGAKQTIQKELTTPTGAALLAGLVTPGDFGGQPLMLTEAIGYGAGEHRLPIPNLLRILVGRPEYAQSADAPFAQNGAASGQFTRGAEADGGFARDEVLSLECSLDDANPEWIGDLFDQLYGAGALEVYLTPVQKKKNRPATLCTVLCEPARETQLLEILFRESTTLGVRRQLIERRKLERELRTVQTEFGPVQIKLGLHAGRVYNVAPEFESCRELARKHDTPLKSVYAAAQNAAERLQYDANFRAGAARADSQENDA